MGSTRSLVGAFVLIASVIALAVKGGVFEPKRSPPDAREWCVVDAAGKPIEGATISLLREEVLVGIDNARPALRTTATNSRGRFELDLERGRTLHAWKPGYVGTALDLGTEPPVTLVLMPAATLSGRVISGRDGSPVADAGVVPLNSGSPEWQLATRTAADGSFNVDGLYPSGEYAFSIEPRNAVPFVVEYSADEAKHYETEFKTPEVAGRFRGVVSDLVSRQPIAGAKIVAWGSQFGNSNRKVDVATSSFDGSFELDVATDALSFGVEASQEGYACARYEFFASDKMFDAGRRYEFLLEPECRLQGTITDFDGVPYTDGSVYLGMVQRDEQLAELPGGLELGARGKDCEVDADGRYVLDGLTSGASYLLFYSNPARWRVAQVGGIEFEPGASKTWNLKLARQPSRIYGSITVNGEPIEARVALMQDGKQFFDDRSENSKRLGFNLEFRATGPAELLMWFDPYFDVELHSEPIVLTAGTAQRRDIANFRDLSRIRGRCVGANRDGGSPLEADVRVIAKRKEDGARAETVTRSDGSFELVLPDAQWSRWELELDPVRFKTVSEPVRSGSLAAYLIGLPRT